VGGYTGGHFRALGWQLRNQLIGADMDLHIRGILGAVGLSAVLVGCGSSGNDNPVVYAYPAVGVYSGSMTGLGNAQRTVVLPNFEYWVIYGSEGGSSNFTMNGSIYGPDIRPYSSVDYTGGTIYGASSSVAANVRALYQSNGLVNGVATTAQSSVYNFDGRPYFQSTSSGIQGFWTVRALDNQLVNIDIATGGGFSATTQSSCVFTGSLTSSGINNVYRVSIVDVNRCLSNSISLAGLALFETSFARQQQLLISAIGSNVGIGLYGAR
jgi:hypothetical protein